MNASLDCIRYFLFLFICFCLNIYPFIKKEFIRCDLHNVWVFRIGQSRMLCSSRKSVKMERNINEEGGEAAEAECEADGHKTL